MVRALRLAFVALGFALLGACATVPQMAGSSGRSVSLERDFAGRFYARGVFTNTLSGAKRPFSTAFHGYRKDGQFRLNERIAFDDGERQNLTWHFTRLGPGHYSGTRSDVIGTADVRETDGVLRLSYDVKLTGGTQVHFEDVIVHEADGRLHNKAVVSKFGVPVGTVDIHFARSMAALK